MADAKVCGLELSAALEKMRERLKEIDESALRTKLQEKLSNLRKTAEMDFRFDRTEEIQKALADISDALDSSIKRNALLENFDKRLGSVKTEGQLKGRIDELFQNRGTHSAWRRCVWVL